MEISTLIYLIGGIISMAAALIAVKSDVFNNINLAVSNKDFLLKFILPFGIAILAVTLMLLSLRMNRFSDSELEGEIKQIQKIQESISYIDNYLEQQKAEIYDTKAVIEKLKKEHALLDSISKTDEQIIRNVMLVQQKIQRKQRWQEWFIAFVIGFITSLISGFIVNLLRKKMNTK